MRESEFALFLLAPIPPMRAAGGTAEAALVDPSAEDGMQPR